MPNSVAQPLGKLSSFLEDPRAFEGRRRPRGLRRFIKTSFENILWWGSPGTPGGVPRDHFFFKNFVSDNLNLKKPQKVCGLSLKGL